MNNQFIDKLLVSTTKSRIVAHMIYWLCVISGFILVQPYLLDKLGIKLFLISVSVKFLLIIGMCYFNLYILIPALIYKKNNLLFYFLGLMVLNLGFAFALFGADYYLYQYTYQPGDEIRSFSDNLYFFTAHFVGNFWYLGSTSALKFARKYFHERIERNKIQISNLQTEIKYLVAQINPHFLFNAINSIYVQIDRQNSGARATVAKFSEMLRYQLYECNEEKVSFKKELDYIQNYVDLQKIRKSGRHRIDFRYPSDILNIEIPPMLFIGFIENAFKYLSNDKDRDNFVLIEFILSGTLLELKVVNTHHQSPSENPKTGQQGIGLKNIRRRLELQFPQKHQLKIINTETLFSVHLTLDLSQSQVENSLNPVSKLVVSTG